MGVDDAGGRGEEGRFCRDIRFQGVNLPFPEKGQPFDAVFFGPFFQIRQRCFFLFVGGDNQLSHPLMRDIALPAVFIEEGVPRDAEDRPEKIGREVDPGVDHLTVAGARLLAEAGVFLHDQDVPVMRGQLFGDGETDDAGPDDGDSEGIHQKWVRGGLPTGYTLKPISKQRRWSRMFRPSKMKAGFAMESKIFRKSRFR